LYKIWKIMRLADKNETLTHTKLSLEIGEITIYENFVIAELHEGITVTLDSAQDLIKKATTYFGDRPFVYISIRKNSYAVDPIIYIKISEITTLKAIAFVSNKLLDNYNIKIEKHFFKKPMEIFNSLPDALQWAKSNL